MSQELKVGSVGSLTIVTKGGEGWDGNSHKSAFKNCYM